MGYHKPVLLHESINGLNIKPKGSYVDLTFGGGGHSREVLKKLGTNGRLIAFDQDRDAEVNIPNDKRFTFIGANYRYLRNYLRYFAIDKVDGILADLGISSHQIDQPQRGFSFREEAVLDMRMDARSKRTASHILSEYDLDGLTAVFRNYGEFRNAGAIASALVDARKDQPIHTSHDLVRALDNLMPENQSSKFLARIYQALRIEVNRELESLREMLTQTAGCMTAGGRLVVITYHSLEDRLVKNYMRSGNLQGEVQKDFYGKASVPWKLINRNVITPSEGEIRDNKRARSAKLRIAERTD